MNAIKNVLFISYDGMTDPLGQSQVIPYLSGLTKYGYKFTILSCDKPDRYKANADIINNNIAAYPIKWISLPYTKNPPVLSSLYDLYQMRSAIKKENKKERFDMVHTRSGTPSLLGLWMKKKYGTKFINDIRGFWADERIDGGMWNKANPLYNFLYKFFKKKEYACLEYADYNISLTNAGKDEILSWKNIKNQPVKIKVIPCSADLNLFDATKVDEALRSSFAASLNITEHDFIISYLGSIGGWYLTDQMLHFCKMVSEKMPTAKFLFIAPHHHEQIIKAARDAGLNPDKIIVTKAKRTEVPALLCFSSYSIFFIKPCYSKIASSPTKHGEIMAMGIPVIANGGVGDVQEIIEMNHGGFVVNNFSKEEYTRIIDQITANKIFDSAKIRNGAEQMYSLDNAIQSYLEVYRLVLP